MSYETSCILVGLGMVAGGAYCIAFHPDERVYGWIVGLIGGWLVLSQHPFFRDTLLDIDTWTRGNPRDSYDDD